ncbi:hypothetical protein P9112_013540 [Eukaryota sp. TZLM1-RC]
MVEISPSQSHVDTLCLFKAFQVPPRLRVHGDVFCPLPKVSFMEDYCVFLYSLLLQLYNHFEKPFPKITHYKTLTSALEGLSEEIGVGACNFLKNLVPTELDFCCNSEICSEDVLNRFKGKIERFLNDASEYPENPRVFGFLDEVMLLFVH